MKNISKSIIIAMFLFTTAHAEDRIRVVGIEQGAKGSYVAGYLEPVGKMKDPTNNMVVGQLEVDGKNVNVVGVKLDNSLFRVVHDKVYIVEKN